MKDLILFILTILLLVFVFEASNNGIKPTIDKYWLGKDNIEQVEIKK